jgi:hypothetical protein
VNSTTDGNDEHGPESETGASSHGWKSPQTIARVLGLFLFGLLFWIESPPRFLLSEGRASFVLAVILWLGELLAYAVGVAGVIVLFVFLGSHVWYLLRNARRWYRLQEIRSWRAKRACNDK